MAFLRRPRPRTNEVFSSYLLRLTQANGYSNYQAILDYVSIQSDLHKLNYLPKDTANLTVLSQMTKVEEGHLWEMVFLEIGDRKIKAYGSVLDYEWLEREKIKICPTCFATDGYYHKYWSLWCYTSCHIHQCLLVDRCPQCQSVWRWDDLKNNWKCKCGWNFSETSIDKIQAEENFLSRLVAHCCELVETESVAIDRQSPLFSLSLSQISLLMISTALSLHNPGDSIYQLQLPSINKDLHALLSKSVLVYQSESKNLSYFIEWFDRFYRLEYKRLGQRKNHLQKLSLITTFRRKLEDLHLTNPTYNLRKQRAKVCPCCLEKKPYCRKIWNLVPLTVCPIHHCLLLDICPQCDRTIRWDRNSVNKCKHCELDWRSIQPEILELEDTIPSHLLSAACGLEQLGAAELQIIGEDHPILNLELEDLISLFTFFAGQLIDIGDTTGKFIATSSNNAELHKLLLSAWNCLQNFPQGFERFLEWYKNKSSHPERDTGIAKDFGNFYRRLYKNFPRHTFGFLHTAFENYLATQWDGGYLNSKLGRIEMPDDCDRKFLSGVETAKLLKMTEAWVLRSVECGTLKGRLRKMGKRTSVLVEKESAEAYLQNLKNSISPKDVAQILGIERKAVVNLIEHSCMPAFRGRTVDGHQKWLINRNAPVDLLNRIDTLISKTTDNKTTDECSFDLAIRRLSGSGCSTGRLVRAILDRTIVPVYKNKGVGLKRYCFDTQDINRLVKEYFKKDEDILNVLEVAILLGVKQQVAAFWIDRGFIEAEIEIHQHHRHRKVLRSSIKEFQAKYVTAVELARQINTSSRKVISLLGEQNVFPISGKSVDGGRQYLFLKKEVG